MKRIEEALEEFGVKYEIKNNSALVEFWTDTAGQDIPVEFEYDGTAKDFVDKFSEYAERYDVDEEVELFANMRGKRGVPETIKELLDDCQEAKDTLLKIAEALKSAISEEKDNPKVKYGISISYSWGDNEDIERYGLYDNERDAYKKACELAGKEAFVQNEDFVPEKTCAIYYNAAEKHIELYYNHDNSWCFYDVVKAA